jgi:hypothetical protein
MNDRLDNVARAQYLVLLIEICINDIIRVLMFFLCILMHGHNFTDVLMEYIMLNRTTQGNENINIELGMMKLCLAELLLEWSGKSASDCFILCASTFASKGSV